MSIRNTCSVFNACRRITRLVPVALAILVLAGCATSQFAKDPLKSKAAVGEGTVLVSLTINTGEVGQFDAIHLQRLQDTNNALISKSHILTNALPGLSRDTSLFVGLIPAGDYQFELLLDQQSQKFLRLGEMHSQLVGTFKVTAGQTTDLGRLVLTAVNTGVAVGRSTLIRDNRGLVQRFASSYGNLLQATPLAGWQIDKQEKDIAEIFALGHPQGAGGFAELPTGEVVGGTRMGTVIQRSTEGKWKVLARTGTLDAVLWTVPFTSADSVLVAAGELGMLIKVDAAGQIKALDPGDLPVGNYFFVDRNEAGSEWIIGVQTPKEAALYRSPSLEKGQWTRMRGDTIEFSTWSGARFVWAWPLAGGVGFASTKLSKVACYDYGSRIWKEHASPGARSLIGLAPGPTPAFGVLTSAPGGLAGVFAKTHYTADCGKTWIETNSPYKVKVVPPLLLADDRILEAGGVFGDKGLYASADGGRTWNKQTDAVAFSEVVWALRGGGLLGVSRGQFGIENILHSADGGRTWKTELSSLDRELLRMQQERNVK